jgi:hypothetical protein
LRRGLQLLLNTSQTLFESIQPHLRRRRHLLRGLQPLLGGLQPLPGGLQPLPGGLQPLPVYHLLGGRGNLQSMSSSLLLVYTGWAGQEQVIGAHCSLAKAAGGGDLLDVVAGPMGKDLPICQIII